MRHLQAIAEAMLHVNSYGLPAEEAFPSTQDNLLSFASSNCQNLSRFLSIMNKTGSRHNLADLCNLCNRLKWHPLLWAFSVTHRMQSSLAFHGMLMPRTWQVFRSTIQFSRSSRHDIPSYWASAFRRCRCWSSQWMYSPAHSDSRCCSKTDMKSMIFRTHWFLNIFCHYDQEVLQVEFLQLFLHNQHRCDVGCLSRATLDLDSIGRS